MSWVQDFPLRTSSFAPDQSRSSLANKFQAALTLMLTKMHTEAGIQLLLKEGLISTPSGKPDIGSILAQYDFSRVKVALVCSIPGKFQNKEMQTVGHTGLMRALRNIGARCPDDKNLSLECQVIPGFPHGVRLPHMH